MFKDECANDEILYALKLIKLDKKGNQKGY